MPYLEESFSPDSDTVITFKVESVNQGVIDSMRKALPMMELYSNMLGNFIHDSTTVTVEITKAGDVSFEIPDPVLNEPVPAPDQ